MARFLSLAVCVQFAASCRYLPEPAATPQTVPARAPSDAPPLLFPNHDLGDDAVVRIVTPHTSCTGTLFGSRLVLTAHHCLAVLDETGAYVRSNVLPSEVQVQLGGDYLPWGEVGVSHLVAPECGYDAGVGDLAILVLSEPLNDISPKQVDLETRPFKEQKIEAIGFGRCADSDEGIRLRERRGGNIEVIEPSRFQVQAAICPGDSGGPGLNEDGVVIGVVSASAIDGQQETTNRTEFTRVDHWQELFSNAQRLVEGANPAELPPVAGCEGIEPERGSME